MMSDIKNKCVKTHIFKGVNVFCLFHLMNDDRYCNVDIVFQSPSGKYLGFELKFFYKDNYDNNLIKNIPYIVADERGTLFVIVGKDCEYINTPYDIFGPIVDMCNMHKSVYCKYDDLTHYYHFKADFNYEVLVSIQYLWNHYNESGDVNTHTNTYCKLIIGKYYNGI